MGDQMCKMALVTIFPSQHFVELNELEHNGNNQKNEQYHVQRRLGRFLPMTFSCVSNEFLWPSCFVMQINARLIKFHPTLCVHVKGRWGFFCHFFVAMPKKRFGCWFR